MKTFNRITVEHLSSEIFTAAEKAYPLFKLYGWTYGENDHITREELINCVTRITESALDAFYESDSDYRDAQVSSGRFIVQVREYEDEVDVNISLNLGGHTWFKAHPKY